MPIGVTELDGAKRGECQSSESRPASPDADVVVVAAGPDGRGGRATRLRSRQAQAPPWEEEDIYAGRINCPCAPSHRLLVDVERGCNVQVCVHHASAVRFCYFCKELAPFGGCGRCGGARRLAGLLGRVRQAASFTGKGWGHIRSRIFGPDGTGLMDVLDEMIRWEDLPCADPAFSICVEPLDKADTAAPPDALDRRCHCGARGCRCGAALKERVERARQAGDATAELGLLRDVWRALVFGPAGRAGGPGAAPGSAGDESCDSDSSSDREATVATTAMETEEAGAGGEGREPHALVPPPTLPAHSTRSPASPKACLAAPLRLAWSLL
jgi:hypothetical protein